MKEIKLTQEQFAMVDDEDYEYLTQWRWWAAFDKKRNCFYAVKKSKSINGKRHNIRLSRFILNVTDPNIKVDHIDHNPLNNCRKNLRIATQAQNAANRSPRKNGTSLYIGVSWRESHKKWCAQITKNYKCNHIGYFLDEIEAAKAYDVKAKELHGEFANLNFAI